MTTISPEKQLETTSGSSVQLQIVHSEPGQPLALEFARCCLCQIDDCEPVAVGEDFEYRTCPDEFLAVRCRQCGLVYLNPRPAASEFQRIYPDNYHAFDFQPAQFGFVYRVRRWLEGRRLLRWCRDLPAEANILDVGCGDGFHLGLLRQFGQSTWQLEGVDVDPRATQAAANLGITILQGEVESAGLAEGKYHLILMIMTVEHLPDPAATLHKVAQLLAPGGKVVIVTDNVRSPDFALFGGRHWGGYHFPRHTYLFDKQTLALLASSAGLQVERIATAVSPVNWVYSIRNWLDDWGAPRWLVNCFSLKSVIALGIFTLLDMQLSWLGRGAILQAIFVKPESAEDCR